MDGDDRDDIGSPLDWVGIGQLTDTGPIGCLLGAVGGLIGYVLVRRRRRPRSEVPIPSGPRC
jgi:hypothetical protein